MTTTPSIQLITKQKMLATISIKIIQILGEADGWPPHPLDQVPDDIFLTWEVESCSFQNGHQFH